MKVLTIALLLLAISCQVFCQSNWPYRIPAGVKVESIIPFEDLYLYPSFQKCAIHYSDGKSSLAMANYNKLYQKMVVINVRKDTTFLKNDYLIKKFDFGDTLILNDYKFGLIELGTETTYPKLGKRGFLHLIPVDEGTFDGYSNFVDPSTTNIVLRRIGSDEERVMTDQFARSNIIAEKKVVYFWMDRNQRILPATAKNLYKILPRHKDIIREYVKAESIDFKDEVELQKLIAFCQRL